LPDEKYARSKRAAMLHIKNISWHFGLVIFFHVPKMKFNEEVNRYEKEYK